MSDTERPAQQTRGGRILKNLLMFGDAAVMTLQAQLHTRWAHRLLCTAELLQKKSGKKGKVYRQNSSWANEIELGEC